MSRLGRNFTHNFFYVSAPEFHAGPGRSFASIVQGREHVVKFVIVRSKQSFALVVS